MDHYDIVIVGAGPVGLLLSTCLARWGYRIKHIDNRAQPTTSGRADGIQPRSLDLLKNMGLKHAIMAHNPAKVYEVAFWDPSAKGGIARSGTWPSCPKFIDARYPFTTLLHQGLIERVFIDDLAKNGVKIDRPWTITDFEKDDQDEHYPIRVDLATADGQGLKETVRAKYLFSGEGGRSFIRQKLGINMKYKDPISHVWGVMDGVVKTNFPDIKMKCTIHSDAGSIMVIPREANMVRLYIQIASSDQDDFNPRKTATPQEVQEHAKAIFKPYEIEWENVDWYSVYPIGQGIAERYTLDERIIMGGDACHTHSPKAGQGMNTAFLDAQNLAWKIHHVELGLLPRSLLATYEHERKKIADDLLAFDNNYAKLFSTRQPAPDEISSAATAPPEQNSFIAAFKESCEFTSGYGVAYPPNLLNWSPAHPSAPHSPLFLTHPDATSLRPGRILAPATVTRVADANIVPLEQQIPADGAWRLYLFAGTPPARDTVPPALADFAAHAASSRLAALAPAAVRYATVFACARAAVEIDTMVPPLLRADRDRVFADGVDEAHAPAHAKMFGGAWREGGEGAAGVIVVRPDGYVGCVVRLVEGRGTVDALDAYFGAFLAP